jgi:hypothetical protein
VVCCDEKGVAAFQLLRHRRNEPQAHVGIRLITRNGYDWSARYPLVVEAVNHLKLRSCLIDG